MPEQTDEEIAAAVQNGQAESFGILVERYEPKIMRYAKKFLLDDHDGEDVAQEVFIKAYSNIKSFDPRRRFSPWIYRIAHNEFLNAIRKRTLSPTIPFDPDTFFPHPVAKETADENILSEELRGAMDGTLHKIHTKYREPLILFYYEEMDYTQISQILAIPVSTVGVRLKRGREMLGKLIKTHYV